MSKRIEDQRGRLKHAAEIAFFNALIIDLKLVCLGRPTISRIDMERLMEGTEMVSKLLKCREQTRFL